MEFRGEYGFAKSPTQIWALLNDPAFLKDVIPGCERFEPVEENLFDVKSKFGVGPLSLSMKGRVTLDPVEPPQHYRMSADAGTILGRANGEATVHLRAISGGTAFGYVASVDMGNGLAKLGSQALSGTVETLTRMFFERLATKMGTELIDVS